MERKRKFLALLKDAELARVHGTRCTHLSKCMPYRDPAQRAAWMREYRKRKRVGLVGVSASLPSAASVVRVPEPSAATIRTTESLGAQPVSATTKFVLKRARSTFKTALELARTFPFGVLASQACPYCYNTGYSSPGTPCSYCRGG